ncbi:hypothetical protein HMPREF0083_00542 [Aneurinibacillus aneurinilyticus ATCC 12856]|uniref:LSM domain-containing protein n=1 Tax=Aneurinibacillus aneurinilyticus ATCC 12856 TaxID=649747 RepID=U1YGZ2_ANEAE|nr:hypothetical protein HMPREF0083_00542 [Aneurinibacillus aneurinilyticus ATCC 12856]
MDHLPFILRLRCHGKALLGTLVAFDRSMNSFMQTVFHLKNVCFLGVECIK